MPVTVVISTNFTLFQHTLPPIFSSHLLAFLLDTPPCFLITDLFFILCFEGTDAVAGVLVCPPNNSCSNEDD